MLEKLSYPDVFSEKFCQEDKYQQQLHRLVEKQYKLSSIAPVIILQLQKITLATEKFSKDEQSTTRLNLDETEGLRQEFALLKVEVKSYDKLLFDGPI